MLEGLQLLSAIANYGVHHIHALSTGLMMVQSNPDSGIDLSNFDLDKLKNMDWEQIKQLLLDLVEFIKSHAEALKQLIQNLVNGK